MDNDWICDFLPSLKKSFTYFMTDFSFIFSWEITDDLKEWFQCHDLTNFFSFLYDSNQKFLKRIENLLFSRSKIIKDSVESFQD